PRHVQRSGHRGHRRPEDVTGGTERREGLVVDQRIADQAVHRNRAGGVDEQECLAAGQKRNIAIRRLHRDARRWVAAQRKALHCARHCNAATIRLYQRFSVAANLTMRDEILDFWFGRPDTPGFGEPRAEWFRKDVAFDGALRARFASAIDMALAGCFAAWTDPRGILARVLLLDQFTRNCYRDAPRSFAGDTLALAIAEQAVMRNDDAALIPVER